MNRRAVSRSSAILIALSAAFLTSLARSPDIAYAQPAPIGLRSVTHDSSLNGTGAIGAPLGLSSDLQFPGIVGMSVAEYGAGGLAATINNLAPSGKGVVHIQCGDNEGTRITGIDATGYNIGDLVYIENTDGTQDDSVCTLRHETTSSAANRFSTPEERDFYLGPQQGALAMRMPILDGSGAPTANIRWKVISTPRQMRAVIQNLHLFPRLDVGVATPISGTFNDWQPTGDPLGSAWGEAGHNLTWLDSTAVRVATNASGATITGMYWGGNGPTTADMGAVKVITNFGPGNLTFKYDNASSGVDDRMKTPCARDLVLGTGDTLFAFHDITWQVIPSRPSQVCAERATVAATDANNPAIDVTMVSSETQGVQIINSGTGQTPSGGVSNGIKVLMNGTYNATSGPMSPSGITSVCTATRSAGANTVDCHALTVQATGCSGGTCRAMYASGGEVRLASGSPFIAGDTSDLVGNVTTYANTTCGDQDTDAFSQRGSATLRKDSTTLTRAVFQNRGIDSSTDGYGLRVDLDSSAGAGTNAGSLDFTSENATFATTTADATFSLMLALDGTLTERLKITSDGTTTIGGYTQITKSADQDVTNSTTLTDDTGLTFSVTAGKIYAIDAFLIVGGSDTTGDYKDAWTVAAGTMDCTGTGISVTTADAIQTNTIIATAAASTSSTAIGTRADASLPIAVRETLACKVSNTTTLKHQFAENSAVSAKVARTMAGSYVQYRQLN